VDAPTRLRRRPVPVALAILAIPLTIAAAAAIRPVNLTEVLLVGLVEVMGVSLLAGRTVAALTALGTVAAVNWFLVPPYGTFAIQQQQNVVSLTIFLLLAVAVSTGVDAAMTSETRATAAAAREAALSEVLRPVERSPQDALEAFRDTFGLSSVVLVDARSGDAVLRAGQPSGEGRVLSVVVDPGYRIDGYGPEIMGSETAFTTAMATAVVASWESEQLRAAQERSARLAAIDEARAALLASIGHDLRTPLAGIRLNAEALQLAAGVMPGPEQEQVIADLRESAIRVDQVLGAVLDSSRVEAGVQPVLIDQVDAGAVARAAAATWGSPRISVQVPPGLAPLRSDPALLERIVANLVSNALAHTPPEAGVVVSCRPGAIAVIDHGPGLVEGGGDAGRARAGMGLLIVDRLAQAIGATVDYGLTPGGGVTAVVTVDGGAK
jgi:two-component system sensor histidine kinase KdpD